MNAKIINHCPLAIPFIANAAMPITFERNQDVPEQPGLAPVEITDVIHKKLAVDLFNVTWDLIEKTDRSPADDDQMLHTAHASCYHWSRVGTPQNFAIGAWQVAHVHSLLRLGDAAVYHAERCLAICRENGLGDWRLAFAYEALARAHASAGHTHEARRYRAQAAEAGDAITEEGERNHFRAELAKGPWFDADE